ncbi:MAG: fibronectin type III domain-containing protein [Chloroflexales bacterium]|nr:fibronectin type III domain-containing protein [Chloroflexales bacterium]
MKDPNINSQAATTEPGLVITGHVRLHNSNGPGLENVTIYRRFASYPGVQVAVTDANGYYDSGYAYIPGEEMVTVWAEKDGYVFEPQQYYWRHYYGYEERELDFVATPVATLPPPTTPTTPPATVPPPTTPTTPPATVSPPTTPTPGSGTLPAAPSNLSGADSSVQQIDLTWIDNANNEDGFRIERCTGLLCRSFVEIATVDADVTSYADATVRPRVFYNYRVRAYNADGNSAYSNKALVWMSR